MFFLNKEISLKSSSFGIPPRIKITFLEIDSSALIAESIFVDLESFIKSINGSYSNVVGLPLYETKNLLLSAGLKCD